VRGVKRPKADNNEGKTPALGDGQARALLEAPPSDTLAAAGTQVTNPKTPIYIKKGILTNSDKRSRVFLASFEGKRENLRLKNPSKVFKAGKHLNNPI
jgi:hypothetical protein